MNAAFSMSYLKSLVGSAAKDDDAQDAFEYMLAVGGVVVTMVIALMAFDAVIAGILGLVCPAVDTADPLAAIGSCITGG